MIDPNMTTLLGAKVRAWGGLAACPEPGDSRFYSHEIEGVVTAVAVGPKGIVLAIEQTVDTAWCKVGSLQQVVAWDDAIRIVEKAPTTPDDRLKELTERVAKLEGPPTPYSAEAVAEIRILRAARDGLRQRMHDTVAKHAALVAACERLGDLVGDPTPGEFTGAACAVVDSLNEMESADEQLRRIAGYIAAKNPGLDQDEVMKQARAQQKQARAEWGRLREGADEPGRISSRCRFCGRHTDLGRDGACDRDAGLRKDPDVDWVAKRQECEAIYSRRRAEDLAGIDRGAVAEDAFTTGLNSYSADRDGVYWSPNPHAAGTDAHRWFARGQSAAAARFPAPVCHDRPHGEYDPACPICDKGRTVIGPLVGGKG